MNKADYGRYEKWANILEARDKPVSRSVLVSAHQIWHRPIHHYVVHSEAQPKKHPRKYARATTSALWHQEENEDGRHCDQALNYDYCLPASVLVH